MIRSILLISALSLGACSPSFMTTSGAEYLARGAFSDPAIAEAAAYEPNLQFPARIAVVQLVYGQATPVQAPLLEVAEPVLNHPEMGEMVMLSATAMAISDGQRYIGPERASHLRRHAASRHADYLLVIALDPSRNTAEALFLDVRNGYPYATVSADVPGQGGTNFWGNPMRDPARIERHADRLARALAPELAQMFMGLVQNAG